MERTEVVRSLNPFGWVGDHAMQWISSEKQRVLHFGTAAQGFLDEKRRGQQLSRIHKRHQEMDERVKQFAGNIFDEKKRSAHISAIHEFGIKAHRKMDRTVQFWTRTIAIYASYKVYSISLHLFLHNPFIQFQFTDIFVLLWMVQESQPSRTLEWGLRSV